MVKFIFSSDYNVLAGMVLSGSGGSGAAGGRARDARPTGPFAIQSPPGRRHYIDWGIAAWKADIERRDGHPAGQSPLLFAIECQPCGLERGVAS